MPPCWNPGMDDTCVTNACIHAFFFLNENQMFPSNKIDPSVGAKVPP